MIEILQEAQLSTDLEANGNKMLNLGDPSPVPTNLVASDDPRLTDSRIPLDGSVTNASVALAAGIEQSKLNLNGVIPPAWLGTAADQAAPGDLAEYVANKGQPNGYASLDGTGKIPVAQVPTEVGTGTVTSVGLSMPTEFLVADSPITTSGELVVSWNDAPSLSWFGNAALVPGVPSFNAAALPVGLIPSLDTSKIVSGEFDPARLPLAVGLGVGHVSGAVPDPGDGSGGALATDYLARDMTYKPIPGLSISYQPNVVNPVLSPSAEIIGAKKITFSTTTPNAVLFYSLTSAAADFAEVPEAGYIELDPLATVWSYAARSGYNNSSIVSYTNPNA